MKKTKKIIISSALLGVLAVPVVASAALSTITVGNGKFNSYISSDRLGMGIKSVTGISDAKSNINEVTSQVSGGSLVKSRTRAHSYRNSLREGASYRVTNTGKATNGAYKAHSGNA